MFKVAMFIIFVAGMVAGKNLYMMIDVSGYEPSWWKFLMAVATAIAWAIVAKEER